MGFKVVQCTNCGGELQLDDSKEFGYCSSCGTQIMLKETVEVKHTGKVSIDYEDKIRNTMEVADNSFRFGRYEEARKYYLKALEYDLDNPIALTRKDIAGAHIGDGSTRAEIVSGYKMATRNIFNRMNQAGEGQDAEIAELQRLLNVCTDDMVNFIEGIQKGRMSALRQVTNSCFKDKESAEDFFIDIIHGGMDIIDDILYVIPVSMPHYQKRIVDMQRELGNALMHVQLKYVAGYGGDGGTEPKIKFTQIKKSEQTYLALTTLLNRATDIIAAQPENREKNEEFKGRIEEINHQYEKQTEEYNNFVTVYKERKKEAPKCLGLFGISGVGAVIMIIAGLMVGGASGWTTGIFIFIVAAAIHFGVKYFMDENYMKNNHPELTNNKKQARMEQQKLQEKLKQVNKEYETFRNSL